MNDQFPLSFYQVDFDCNLSGIEENFPKSHQNPKKTVVVVKRLVAFGGEDPALYGAHSLR